MMKINKLLTIICIILPMLLFLNSDYAFSSDLSRSLRPSLGNYGRLRTEMHRVVYIAKEIKGQQVIIAEMPRYLAEEKDLVYVSKKGALSFADEVDNTLEFIDIIGINEDGDEKVIGKTLRKKKVSDLAHERGLMHRTANAFVLTPNGEVVIDRRAHNKAQPLRLSILGGHVASGEGYGVTIKQEILQELGFSEGWTLQGKIVRIGDEGAFKSPSDDTKNKERRSLYVYVMSKEEYSLVQEGKRAMDEKKAGITEERFRADLEKAQILGTGGGEVWGRYIEDMDELLGSERDETGPYIQLKDAFIDSEENDPERKVYFTEDLLQPLLEDTQVIETIRFIVRFLREGKAVTEVDLPAFLSARDFETLRNYRDEKGRDAAKLQLMEEIGFIENAVEDLSQRDAGVNYGMAFVGGYPLGGDAGKAIEKWDGEISEITNGKVRLNVARSHITVGVAMRSRPRLLNEDDFSAIDFNGVLTAVAQANRYHIKFSNVLWGIRGDGSLVLKGELVQGGEGFYQLQNAFADAGFNLKRKILLRSGQKPAAFVTLTHINTTTLDALTYEELIGLKTWVDVHNKIEDEISCDIEDIVLVNYRDRTLSAISPPKRLRLGAEDSFNGDSLRKELLTPWQALETALAGAAITDLIRVHLPQEYHGHFDIPNLPLESHQEGPLLIDHLQTMLDILNTAENNMSIPSEYRAILAAPENRQFFEAFIELHDIGKLTIHTAHTEEEFNLYPKHEDESVNIVKGDDRLAKGLSNRDILIEVIRLHGFFYEASKEDMALANFIERSEITDRENEIMPFLIACGFLDVLGTDRGKERNVKAVGGVANFAEAYGIYRDTKITTTIPKEAQKSL